MKIRLWHVLVVCLVLGCITLAVVVALYGNAVVPEPTSPELAQRDAPTLTRTSVDAPSIIHVGGVVVYTDGGPAEGITIDIDGPNDVETRVETGPDGRFSADVEGPVEVEPTVGSTPDDVPVSSDTDDLHFTIPMECPLTVYVEDPDGQPVDGDVGVRVQSSLGWSGTRTHDLEQGVSEFPRVSCGIATRRP